MNKLVKISDFFEVGNNLPITLIAGPCQMESREHTMMMCEGIKEAASEHRINFIFKASFDKANRSSISGKRGIGLEKALPIFEEVRKQFGCPVFTDVHTEEQCKIAAEVVDVIQIPAFLCRQTDLLLAAAQTGKVVNVKKGQFLAPWDVKNIINKLEHGGTNKIMLTERGVSFGYNNLISDMRSLKIMAKEGYPVIFDATHSVQQPGGLGSASGGQREFVPTLAKAATAVGIAGIYMETHQDPDNAPSDGPCMWRLDKLKKLLKILSKLDEIAKTSEF